MSPSRIDELRRRVQNDPASIAFAQLAEEYRRSGQTDEAVRICREGLVRHPGYLSARVTLGRAQLDLGQLAEARQEFEFVVAEAPENLAAVRGLAEIYHREGRSAEALTYYERALALARHDPEIEEIVQQLSRQIGVAASGPPGGLSFEEAHQELLSAAERVPLAAPSVPAASVRSANEGSTAPFDFDRLVAALGSPAAPPQLEAAVAGRATPVIELPDLPDLGPNPFAALEAELRAHEVAPVDLAAAIVPDVSDVPSDSPAIDAFLAAPLDTINREADVAGALAADDVGLESSVPDVAPTELDESLAQVLGIVEHTEPPAPLSEISELVGHAETMADHIPDEPALAAPEPQASHSASSPATAPEDVLGDLESWLNSLHDKSTE